MALPFLSCIPTTPCDDGKCGICENCIMDDVEAQQEQLPSELRDMATLPQEMQNALAQAAEQSQEQDNDERHWSRPTPASSRTVKAANSDKGMGTSQHSPIQKLGLNREKSVKLFARPSVHGSINQGLGEDSYRNIEMDDEENSMTRRNKRTRIYESGKYGEEAAFEVRT